MVECNMEKVNLEINQSMRSGVVYIHRGSRKSRCCSLAVNTVRLLR